MKEQLEQILTALKNAGISVSKIETELGFSNGLIGKAKSGKANLSEEKFKLLEKYYEGVLQGNQNVSIESIEKVVENPTLKIKGVVLGSELTRTAHKCVFQLLLIEFNKYAMNDVPVKDCKKELLALKEKANHPDLNYRQKEAILERVDHYINGTYGTPFNQNNAYKNH